MNPTKICFAVLVSALLGACPEESSSKGEPVNMTDPDAADGGKGMQHMTPEPQPSVQKSLVIGSWREDAPAPGYESYMRIDANGEGRLCNADGKSEAAFEVTFKGTNSGTMGAYGYGGGDVLEVDAAGRSLTRTGEDKGDVYVVKLTRVDGVPAWCEEQFEALDMPVDDLPDGDAGPDLPPDPPDVVPACGDATPCDEPNDVVGSWEQQAAPAGYEGFMVIGADGKGYACNADGKSEASFGVAFEGEHGAVLGDYDFGGGDVLSVEGDVLTRTTEEKGEIYTSTYARVQNVPAWCQMQIDALN